MQAARPPPPHLHRGLAPPIACVISATPPPIPPRPVATLRCPPARPPRCLAPGPAAAPAWPASLRCWRRSCRSSTPTWSPSQSSGRPGCVSVEGAGACRACMESQAAARLGGPAVRGARGAIAWLSWPCPRSPSMAGTRRQMRTHARAHACTACIILQANTRTPTCRQTHQGCTQKNTRMRRAKDAECKERHAELEAATSARDQVRRAGGARTGMGGVGSCGGAQDQVNAWMGRGGWVG